ncbi:FkbM family methyltransferase [Caulobacter sp. BK020]|uniref:FkbM family methyltransferase n=1 Tax=Caulobacter sp. BK020 TaxID=2512117 RepID=UPI0010D5FCA4|nr:FkbM family methyltransferase [Caulobacter sp. BK020]TCS10431.1 FkbM family methyltransferase [Caulobacter sp. BK020]
MDKAIIEKLEEHQILQFLGSIEIDLPRCIVDVGGNLEAEISSPYVAKGWRSLIVDPQERCVESLRKKFSAHPNASVVQCACSNEPGELKLFIGLDGPGSEVSTLNSTSDPWMDRVRSAQFEMVTVKTLTALLEEQDFPSEIGILKIDTESWDYNVLLGLDLRKFRPKIIVTEEYYWDVQATIGKHTYLDDNDFVNVGFIGYNSIWMDRACGVRHSLSMLRDWLVAVDRYPSAVQGRGELTRLSPYLKAKSLHSSPVRFDNVLVQAEGLDAMICEQSTRLAVTVANFLHEPVGRLGAQGAPIAVSYHWLHMSGKAAVWDGIRTYLDREIGVNQMVKLDIVVRAPDRPGSYLLVVDLLEENVSWFGPRGGISASQAVVVVEAPSIPLAGAGTSFQAGRDAAPSGNRRTM